MRPRKWREAKGRPVQGNPPDDRILQGPGCYRHKRVCVDFFSATPRLPIPGIHNVPGMRLSGMAESAAPMGPLETGAGVPPPVGRPRSPANERDGRSAPCSSYATSSGRLFLDRVARQQSPSLLHRHPENKSWTNRMERIIIEW